MVDATGRPVLDQMDGSGRPMTDAAGRPMPDSVSRPTDQSGRPLPPEQHAVRGGAANDFGYNATGGAAGASQPKLDPAGRPMFDASGRMIMEPVLEHGYRAPAVDATGKTIVDPNLGPIGDIHSRSASAAAVAVDSPAQRFDVHGRPLPGDVGQQRLVPGQRGPDAAGLSEGCLLYTSPSPRDRQKSRMPSSA